MDVVGYCCAMLFRWNRWKRCKPSPSFFLHLLLIRRAVWAWCEPPPIFLSISLTVMPINQIFQRAPAPVLSRRQICVAGRKETFETGESSAPNRLFAFSKSVVHRVSNFWDLLYCSYCGFLTNFTAVTSKHTVKPLVQYGMLKIPIEHEVFFVFSFYGLY